MHTRLSRYLACLVFSVLAFPALAQNIPDPASWEPAMQAFDAIDAASPPPAGAIVLTGSSSIARWNEQAAEALTPLTVIARGFGGSVMGDVLFHLDRVALRYNPRAILIYEGDNDTAYDIPTGTIVEQLQQIISRVHDQLPQTRIYIMAVKPSLSRSHIWNRAQEVNARYQALAASDPLVTYVDSATPFLEADGTVMDDIFIEDDLHFNAKGNLVWGAIIRAALMPREIRHEQEQ